MTGEGICACGCGGKTKVSEYSDATKGWVKGQPRRFVRGHNRRRESTLTNAPGGCLITDRSSSGSPYGQRLQERRTISEHREAYERAHGAIPAGHHVHHTCETPGCVNPAHLEALTPREHRRRHAKVTTEQVREIKTLLGGGWNARDIAAAFGLNRQNVHHIRSGRAWADV